jgi:uncharacterized protein YhdP
LQGLAVNLPAPFAKAAAETMPLRFERRYLSAQQERFAVSVGSLASTVFYRRSEAGATRIGTSSGVAIVNDLVGAGDSY